MGNTLSQKKVIPAAGEGNEEKPLTPKKLWFLLGIILLVTFIGFLPSLKNGFVFWDDPEYTYENPVIKDFSFLKVFSFSSYYMGNYHPLTLLWLHWEWLLFPKGDPALYHGFSPFWFHLNNLLFHLLNTLLVFCVIYELMGKKGWKTALISALLFGIHPMHVESVAWISETKDVLYSAFFLCAAWLYLRYQKTIKPEILAISFVLFLLSCFSKGQAVVLPLLFLLFDFFNGRKFNQRAVLEKVPFFIVSILFGYIAIKAQASGSSINMVYSSFLSSICYGCWGLLVYIYKMVLPVHLSGFYPYPTHPFQPLPVYFYLMPVIVAALIIVFYKTLRYSKDWLFGFLFFIIAISVTLRFIPVGDSIVAERYSYIPYIGLFFIGGQLYMKFSRIKRWENVSASILGIIILGLVVLTWQRTQIWKNSFTFWGDVAEKYPDNWRAYNCLGKEYIQAGNWKKALHCYNLAIKRDKWAPPSVFLDRGVLWADKLQNPDSGIADFRKVITFPNKKDPSQMEARINLGIAYNRKADFKNASAIMDEAIRMDPAKPECYLLKGIASIGMQNYRQADSAYSTALKISPDFVEAYLKRGILYTDYLGEYEKGMADFRKILSLQPGNLDATINIGICFFRQNKFAEAIDVYSRVILQSPDDGKLYYLRSLSFEKAGNYKQAFEDGVKAKKLGYEISEKQLVEWRSKAGNY